MRTSDLSAQILDLPDTDLLFFPGFFAPEESDVLFLQLRGGTPWKQETIRLFGKPIPQPRLIAGTTAALPCPPRPKRSRCT